MSTGVGPGRVEAVGPGNSPGSRLAPPGEMTTLRPFGTTPPLTSTASVAMREVARTELS